MTFRRSVVTLLALACTCVVVERIGPPREVEGVSISAAKVSLDTVLVIPGHAVKVQPPGASLKSKPASIPAPSSGCPRLTELRFPEDCTGRAASTAIRTPILVGTVELRI